MEAVLPFNNFDFKFSTTEKAENIYSIHMSIKHIEFPSIDFTFSVDVEGKLNDEDYGNFIMYAIQNLSAWLLYGEAVVALKRPEIPLTGAFDRESGLWYILNEQGERQYEHSFTGEDSTEEEGSELLS